MTYQELLALKASPLLAHYTGGKQPTLTIYRGYGNLHTGKVYQVSGVRDARKLSKQLGAKDHNY